MRLLCLREPDIDALRRLLPVGPLRDVIEGQLADPLLNGTASGRTVLLRDEGATPFLMVRYDDIAEAEAVWTALMPHEETIEWPTR